MSAEMQMFLFSPFLLVPTWYINEYFGGLFAIGFSSLFAVGLTIDVLVEAHNKQWPPSFGTWVFLGLAKLSQICSYVLYVENGIVFQNSILMKWRSCCRFVVLSSLGNAVLMIWIACRVAVTDYMRFTFDNYANPWVRSQPYFASMSLGVLLHLTKTRRPKLSKVYTERVFIYLKNEAQTSFLGGSSADVGFGLCIWDWGVICYWSYRLWYWYKWIPLTCCNYSIQWSTQNSLDFHSGLAHLCLLPWIWR